MPDYDFYLSIINELKVELDFISAEVSYKQNGKYFPVFKFGENICPFKLKIPFKIQKETVGYFLLYKNVSFSKEEKAKAVFLSKILGEKIKDYEISKIFKSQLLILQDAIVEKNKTTRELEEKNEKLIETDKIRRKFLANVSHELRTPLNSIIGFSTALKDEMAGPLNDKQKNCANKILSSAIHLTGLINDILDMTKIESNAMKLNSGVYNLGNVIGEAINIVKPLADEKDIKIVTDLKFAGEFSFDAVKFKQIIYNLAGNAVKFSPRASNIKISTRKKNNIVQISVKDDGVGIEKKYHKKIFEKFVQLSNTNAGNVASSGLGLTITEEFVKLHGGKIKLTSKPGYGAKFTVEIPVIR